MRLCPSEFGFCERSFLISILFIFAKLRHISANYRVYLQEAYRAFHTDFTRVHKYMANIRVGRLETTVTNSPDEEMKKDFEELRHKAKELVSWVGNW